MVEIFVVFTSDLVDGFQRVFEGWEEWMRELQETKA